MGGSKVGAGTDSGCCCSVVEIPSSAVSISTLLLLIAITSIEEVNELVDPTQAVLLHPFRRQVVSASCRALTLSVLPFKVPQHLE